MSLLTKKAHKVLANTVMFNIENIRNMIYIYIYFINLFWKHFYIFYIQDMKKTVFSIPTVFQESSFKKEHSWNTVIGGAVVSLTFRESDTSIH